MKKEERLIFVLACIVLLSLFVIAQEEQAQETHQQTQETQTTPTTEVGVTETTTITSSETTSTSRESSGAITGSVVENPFLDYWWGR